MELARATVVASARATKHEAGGSVTKQGAKNRAKRRSAGALLGVTRPKSKI